MQIVALGAAETRSISIAAPPDIVLELLRDAQRLPDWAPAFARAVEPAGPDWLIDSGGSKLRIHVRVSPEFGTVDLLRPEDPRRGARMRVLDNEDGSELLFTLVFPIGVDDEAIARQMATVEAELRTVRDLCEAHASGVHERTVAPASQRQPFVVTGAPAARCGPRPDGAWSVSDARRRR
jgi:hypothetical protein